jgi:hypothetical protein
MERCAVVRPRTLRLLGHRAHLADVEVHEGPQGLGHVVQEDASKRRRLVEGEQDLVEAERRPDRDLVELVGEGAGDAVEQAVVPRHGGDVEGEDPAGGEAVAREPEEGDVRLVVGVDDDQVVPLVGAAQERARIGVVDREARVVAEAEVAAADAAHGRVELDPVHARLRIEDA